MEYGNKDIVKLFKEDIIEENIVVDAFTKSLKKFIAGVKTINKKKIEKFLSKSKEIDPLTFITFFSKLGGLEGIIGASILIEIAYYIEKRNYNRLLQKALKEVADDKK